MANRSYLHISKLEAFKEWLNERDVPHRPGKGEFQVLQVCVEVHGWKCIHKRLDMPEHYTVDEKLMPLVKQFKEASRG